MYTYVYYMPLENVCYKILADEKVKDLYLRLLIENGAYKIFLNDELVYKKL